MKLLFQLHSLIIINYINFNNFVLIYFKLILIFIKIIKYIYDTMIYDTMIYDYDSSLNSSLNKSINKL